MTHLRAELVIDALKMALRRRQPRWVWSITPIRACSTPAANTLRYLASRGPAQHEPRRHALRQCEVRAVHQDAEIRGGFVKEYESVSDARRSIGHFIEVLYNQKRLHSALGYVPPAEFEATQIEQPTALNPSLTLCLT